MGKAKKRLKNFDFSGDNAAVALVHEMQGGAANGTKTLIMKSTDVVVELSMAEFLVRFFNLWSGDASMIARLLGYSDDTEALWNDEKLEEQVTLLNKVKTIIDDNPDNRVPLTMGDLSDLNQSELRELTKSLADSTNIKITDLVEEEVVDVEKNADGVSNDVPVGKNEETPDEVINPMSVEDVKHEELIQKAVNDATAAKDAELAEIREIVKAFEAEKVAVQKAQFVEKAKEFEVLGVEDFEGFGVALMKMASDESLQSVFDTLEKAVNIAKNAGEFEEAGHSVEGTEVSGVEAILKAKGKIK